jgi:hypothetical protein
MIVLKRRRLRWPHKEFVHRAAPATLKHQFHKEGGQRIRTERNKSSPDDPPLGTCNHGPLVNDLGCHAPLLGQLDDAIGISRPTQARSDHDGAVHTRTLNERRTIADLSGTLPRAYLIDIKDIFHSRQDCCCWLGSNPVGHMVYCKGSSNGDV